MKIKSIFTLLTLLLTACGATAPAPTATATLTLLPPTVTGVPTITSTPETPASEPPACTFPLAGTTMEESTPETYTFSEPRVVLSAPNSEFSISEWLPDSQRVLIKRTVAENGGANYHSIELFNPVKVKTQIYAKLKPRSYDLPVWVSGLDGVLYQEFVAEPVSRDANGKLIPPSNDIAHMLLLLSNGDPENTQTIEDSQYSHFRGYDQYGNPSIHPTSVYSSLAVKPDGSKIVYLKASGEIYQFYSRKILQGQLGAEQLLPIGADMLKNYNVMTYEMAWRPNTEQIFFARHDQAAPIQSFLLDMNTGKTCALDFRTPSSNVLHWPSKVRWSPNGRYLAIVRGTGGFYAASVDLAVLDVATGNWYTLAFSPDIPGMNYIGNHYVGDIAWAPDSYHLAVIGQVRDFPGCADKCREGIDRLYLVDFISGKADLIFPLFQFFGWGVGENLAWSPDGTKILAECSIKWEIVRLCYIPVQINGK